MKKEEKKEKLEIEIGEIENFIDINQKNRLFQIKEEIEKYILDNLQDKLECQKILEYISSIISLVQEIFKNKMKKSIEQYESIMKRDEQTMRILYKNLLTYKLLKDSLDNKIRLLLIKEKEYELIKDKTGAYVKDGEIFYNKQKDNEIIILRQENSNLKNVVENYEKIISEKSLLYDNLKNKYNNFQTKLNNNKNNIKKHAIPNININLNDSSSLTNIDNNLHYSNLNHSDKKNNKNFNYLRYKNISKINNIPFNNCLSSRSLLKKPYVDLNPKDIFNAKKKSSSHSNEHKKKLSSFENQKEICSLKKKSFKREDTFNNNLKLSKFNLLQVYTANSSKSINKSPQNKKTTFSSDIKISSYHSKNNYSQKVNYTNNKNNVNKNKNSKFSIESDNVQKSILSSIPFNKDRDNYNRFIKNEKTGYNRYQMIYCKTKRENHSYKNINNNLYNNNKNYYKKLNNISTNKIFLPLNMKKNGAKTKK